MKKVLYSLLALIISHSAFAWGKNGHLIVGKLADQYLTPEARTEVQKILGNQSLAEACLWMDEVMNDKEYRNQDHWHYAYQDETLPDNAVIKMNEFINAFKGDSVAEENKLLYLRSIAHIVGDLHVPMHCGYIKDHGGHKARYKWEESGEKTNLHKVWDTDLINMQELDVDAYVGKLQESISAEQKDKWSTDDVNVWVTESQDLLPQVYDVNGKVLTKEYYDKNILIVNDRLGMSAVRLAYVLNEMFK